MTAVPDTPRRRMPGGAAPRDLKRLLLQFWVPLLLAAVCVLGAVLQFALGVPGTPVWIGVILVEAVILGTDRLLSSVRPKPRREPAGADGDDQTSAQPPIVQDAPESDGPAAAPPVVSRSPAERESQSRLSAVAWPPPDPAEPWVAGIEFFKGGDYAGFRAMVRDAAGQRIAVGEAMISSWPAPEANPLEEMDILLDALTRALLDIGWGTADSGPSSYSRQFIWNGLEPRTQGGDPLTTELAERVPWPVDTEHLIRCLIEWAPAYRTSRFRAVIYRPGVRRGRAIGESETFRWMLRAPADESDPAQHAAVERLVGALVADGWTQVGQGDEWYEQRFVWDREGEPPDVTG